VAGHVAGSTAFLGSRGLVACLRQDGAVFVSDHRAEGHVPTFDRSLTQLDGCTKAVFIVGSYRHGVIVEK
jgi:hypothetical protein